jgi:carboxyl-terminal processing protease
MKSNRTLLRQSTQIVVVALIFVAGFALGNHSGITTAQSSFAQPEGTETLFEPFWQTWKIIEDEYVDPKGQELDAVRLVDGAIRGLVEALNDQNSGYLDAEQYPIMFDDLSGSIEGIGVVIRTIEDSGAIEVVNILQGTPAAAAGIQIGDIFAEVDGEDVFGISQLELAALVRGPAGTSVDIIMLREGKYVEFTLIRAQITIPNIESRVLEDTAFGYIKLNQFTSAARSEINTALNELDTATLDGLIIDFRGNPGGLLTSAIEVASAFIEEGPILIEDFGAGNETIFRANGNFAYIDIPLVILVDERSASASELVAGALQDTGAATIIGETTFGKGTVQTVQQLVNGGGLRLTIARWLTPDRHWIHEAGITPDIIVEWEPESFDDPDDPQLQTAIEHLQSLLYAPLQ